MNILFLCCAYSETQKELFQNNSRRGYQYAAQNLQEAIISGFWENGTSLTVLTIPALSTYPSGYKSPIVEDSPFMFKGITCGKSVGYTNLPFLNHVDNKKAIALINDWYDKTKGEKCIVVYALLFQQMSIAVAAKKQHPDIKICVIVPDLPRYMGCNKYYKMLGLQKKSLERIDKMIPLFDGFVVLAKPMLDDLQVSDKPYVVVEGIYNDTTDNSDGAIKKFDERTIFYAGGIQSRYGVFDLLEAFSRIDEDSYRLIICGPCPEMDILNYYIQKDRRITYLGLIPTEEARQLQKKATLLINPRHSDEVFTHFSFPSKTLEFMASGTPVLMSPLSSLPDDYSDHLFLFEDESIEGMAKKIQNILLLDNDILRTLGQRASRFILEQKTPKIQVNKILNLIYGIFNNQSVTG